MFTVGDESPDFKVKLMSGVDFHLYTTLKNSSVLINFIRGTWCEECTNHLKRVEKWRTKLNEKTKPITTIIISVEEHGKVKEWLKENPTVYLMVSDEFAVVAKKFGFIVPGDAYSKPGMILISPDKKIQMISDDLVQAQKKAAELLKIHV